VARQRQSGSAYHARPTDSLQHADLPLRALRLKGALKKAKAGRALRSLCTKSIPGLCAGLRCDCDLWSKRKHCV